MKKNIPVHYSFILSSIKKIVLDVGEAFNKYGEVLEVKGLPARIFVFRHPDHVGDILKNSEIGSKKYVRMLPRVKWVMEEGGYIQEGGEKWRERRKLVQGAFKRPCLVDYLEEVPDLVSEMLGEWGQSVDQGKSFDICISLQRLITKANFQMFFSHHLDEPELTQIVQDTHFIQLNFVRVSPLFIPFPANLHFKKCVFRLRKKMSSILSERRKLAGGSPKRDLISVLLEAEKENGWSESDLIGEIFSVYFGASVVATTISWILHLLSKNPGTQDLLIKEVSNELAGNTPDIQHLHNLKYTSASMLETLRIYPASWGYPRYAKSGALIDGYEVPPESMVIPMVYFTHRHPDFWSEPEKFRPERFMGDNAKKIHPYSHLPFGTGARICLGSQFAPMLITTILACIYQKFRLEYASENDGDSVADFGFEIHPRDKIMLTGTYL